MAKYVLRDFPGIQDIERRVSLPNASWAPENDTLQSDKDHLSNLLFGTTEEDTWFGWRSDLSSDEYNRQLDAWELNFKLSYEEWEAQQPVWELMDWDLTDGNGEPLECAWNFDRQIICATKGLRGHLPNIAEVLASNENTKLEDAAENWASSLAKEAAGFRRARR